jgi:hypothetical protein
MAGTLTISTLSDGTNSTSATNCIQGSAKAWVNFNGVSTTSIRASYNVSSVTRNATGVYTVNFTNALADGNFSVALTGNGVYNGSTFQLTSSGSDFESNNTSTQMTFCVRGNGNSSTSLADASVVCATIFR